MRNVVVTFLLMALAGCSAIPAEMTGRFDASPDFIVVNPDGKIFWWPDTQAETQSRFIGIGSADKRQAAVLHVITYSSSPLWPEITYSEDRSRIAVTWREVVAGAAQGRSVEFVRAGK